MKSKYLFLSILTCLNLQAQESIKVKSDKLTAGSRPSAQMSDQTQSNISNYTKLTGRIALPSSELYESYRLGWDNYFSTYPAVMVFAQNTNDVLNAVKWSRETETALRIRSGGHCLEGWNSVDGGIVINVSNLKSIKLNKQNMTVTIGTGITQGEVWEALEGTGLGFPTGDEASVGTGGVMLGGGIGVLSPSWGVACDNILAVEMVVADGKNGARIVQADLNQNTDLLWACRGGGGGNFGVATSYTLQLYPMPNEIVFWKLNWSLDALPAIFEAWQNWAPTADIRIGSTLTASPLGSVAGGDDEIEVSGIFLGTEVEMGKLLSPLSNLQNPKINVTTEKFTKHYKESNSIANTSLYWQYKGSWTYQKYPREAIDIITKYLNAAPTKDCAFWALGWGGKVRNAPQGGTAFFHRNPIFYSEPGIGWSDREQSGECMAWATNFRAALKPYVLGAYVNVPDTAIANWGEAYFGSNFDKLRKIKTKLGSIQRLQF